MGPKILEETQEQYKQEVIDFNWDPVQKKQKDTEFFIRSSATSFSYLLSV